jgi:hypothetical protein
MMSETKSPAELESEARRQTPAAHEPASTPAELEDQMRRNPRPDAPDEAGPTAP